MKRWFISLYLFMLAALLVVALYGFTLPVPATAPAGLLLATAAPLTFFFWLATARPARTEPHPVIVSVLSGLGAVLAMMAVYRFGDDHQPFLIGSVLALAGWLAYVTWYSRQPAPDGAPVPGEKLPEFELEDPDGNAVTTEALAGRPAVLVFYRGNWCPLCVAQIHELAAAWRKVARVGAKLWFVSNQPHQFTREIADRFSIPADFLHDRAGSASRHPARRRADWRCWATPSTRRCPPSSSSTTSASCASSRWPTTTGCARTRRPISSTCYPSKRTDAGAQPPIA
jgi:thiol-disulfide isomerase/thioredoxin